MALPTAAAPITPAAMPRPRPRPLASACCVVVAIMPVAVRATSAKAATLVLIDIVNLHHVWCGPSGLHTHWWRRHRFRFERVWFQSGFAVAAIVSGLHALSLIAR